MKINSRFYCSSADPIIAMDLLIGVLAAGMPIHSFMAAIGKNFARLRHQGQPSGLL